MSVMRRVRDMTIATLNDRLERAEDPVRLIDQFLWATHQDIVQGEQLQRQYAAHVEHLRAQWQDAEAWKERREQQALTALQAGEEHAARLALQDKLAHEERAARYRELYEQASRELRELEQLLAELRDEYRQAYDKRQYYLARMESLRLQQRLNARFGSGAADSRELFRSIDDRITDMELEARSLREVRRMGQELAYRAGTVLQDALEQEMQRLKRKLEQGG
ncbi:MAG TPA: PspA/IM30 family protein [Paenibacillaceae bacterium]